MLVVQKKKKMSLLQSLIATMGLSQFVSACGGGGSAALPTDTSGTSSSETDTPAENAYSELEGTNASDSLVGKWDLAMRISAGDGDDNILTFSKNDYVQGDGGNDFIQAGDGDDIIYGGVGNDIIDPGEGDDEIYAGAGDDIIKLSAGNDYEDGGEGTDTLEIKSSSLDIPFTINLLTGRYFFTPQTNSQSANFSSIENIKSFASVDITIFDTMETNIIELGSGDDSVFSMGGNDTISTGAGSDEVTLGFGSYTVDLGSGDDTVHLGGVLQSKIDGGSGIDLLSVDAAIGVSILYADLDNDFYFTSEIGDSFDGQDISLKDFENVTVIGSVTATIIGNDFTNVITGGSSNDTLSGNAGDDTISGGDGDDILRGGLGNDILIGEEGDDTISGGLGADTLNGGNGADTYLFGDASTNGLDTITLFSTDDKIEFSSSAASENSTNTTGYAEGALGNIISGIGIQVFSDNITVADTTVGPTEAEMETFLGTNEIFFSGVTGDSVYIFADDGINTYGFLVTEGTDGSDKQFTAADDSGLAFVILTGMSDATNLAAENFVDFT